MAGKAKASSSLSRLSRLGSALGIGPKDGHGGQHDEDWYIPYNGPYEMPKNGQGVLGADRSGSRNLDDRTSLRDGALAGRNVKQERIPRKRVSSASALFSDQGKRLTHGLASPTRSAYIDLDHAGGVGDTPIPMQRISNGNISRRPSLISFLSFGVASNKRSASPDNSSRKNKNDPHQSPSIGSHHTPRSLSPPHHDPKPTIRDSPDDSKPTNTYHYSNNLFPDRSGTGLVDADSVLRVTEDPVSYLSHPYAIAFPSSQGHTTSVSKGKERVAFVSEAPAAPPLKPPSRLSRIRASLSSPDLRMFYKRRTSPLEAKQKWFSAQTWCDALFFPRPRLAVRHIDVDGTIFPGSGRICSPLSNPSQPLPGNSKAMEFGLSLTKSKSVVDLRTSNYATIAPARVVRGDAQGSSNEPFLRNFALDDLALPSPVPSLMTVLADGQKLQAERAAWNKQATRSILNRRSRSLSRARSRSQSTIARPQPQHSTEGTFDFLAARTLLGNQAVAPVVHTRGLSEASHPRTSDGSGQGLVPFSFGYTRTKSKSHDHSISAVTSAAGHNHKRNGSTGMAFKPGNSDFGALEGPRGLSLEDPTGLEAVLKSDETRIIRLSEWSDIQEHDSFPVTASVDIDGTSPPPSPSMSGEDVGIALSSPLSGRHFSGGPIRIPAHPYAQGRTHLYVQPVTKEDSVPDTVERNSTIRRQPITHPYAPYGSRLSPMLGTKELAPSKNMFAQISSGQVREIFPDEIQYSPFVIDTPGRSMSTKEFQEVENDGGVKRRSDTLRMGELLSATLRSNRGSPDSGLGSGSERHPFGPTATTESSKAQKDTTTQHPINPSVLEYYDDPTALFPLPKRTHQNERLGNEVSNIETEDTNPTDSRSIVVASSGHLIPILKSSLSPENSSGNSAHVSRESSPPASPPYVDRLDDFERFHDLFYKPTNIHSRSAPSEAVLINDQFAETSDMVDRDPQPVTNHSVSGFTTVAQQLVYDLNEVGDATSNPSLVLLQGSGTEASGSVPALSSTTPVDADNELVHQTFPEDIDRDDASSLLRDLYEGNCESPAEEVTVTLRHVESVVTPLLTMSPHRASSSGQVSLVDGLGSYNHSLGDGQRRRIISSSSTNPPSASVARSSFLTNDTNVSGISGLSDFPIPPSHFMPGRDSMVAPILDLIERESQENDRATPPMDKRESFQTFGVP